MPHPHVHCNDPAELLRRLNQVGVGKVGLARRLPMAAVTEQFPNERKVLAHHDSLADRRVPEVMEAEPAELRISARCPPAVRQNPDTPAFDMTRK